mmetsp:Transcript_55693/g.111668  ORF Transcript_55693/g.111668 Transcript_55693/m.111668 type:complete len:202 (-) Transcript_55693:173-778(-)
MKTSSTTSQWVLSKVECPCRQRRGARASGRPPFAFAARTALPSPPPAAPPPHFPWAQATHPRVGGRWKVAVFVVARSTAMTAVVAATGIVLLSCASFSARAGKERGGKRALRGCGCSWRPNALGCKGRACQTGLQTPQLPPPQALQPPLAPPPLPRLQHRRSCSCCRGCHPRCCCPPATSARPFLLSFLAENSLQPRARTE